MKMYMKTIIPLAAVLLSVSSCSQQQVSFSKDVKPIFDDKCLSCHDGKGEGSEESDFLVTSYANVMKGTKFGPVVTPGDATNSSLYRLIDHKTSTKIQMPPHHKTSVAQGREDPLSHEEIEIIINWIDQGAKNN